MKRAPKIFSLDPAYWVLFLYAAVLAAVLFRVLRRFPRARPWAFAAVQLAFLTQIASIDRRVLLGGVLPLTLGVYALGRLLARRPGAQRSRLLLGFAVAVPLAVLAVTKYSDVAAAWRAATAWIGDLAPAPVVGLSYLAFKSVSFLVDVSSGKTENPRLASFLAYIFFFPTYLSGPIDRYGRFRRDLEQPASLRGGEGFEAFWRMVVGFFKKTVLASAVAPLAISSLTSDQLEAAPPSVLWLSLYAYAFLIYWDFSGYSDIAVGTGRFFGIKVPENFRAPYRSRNLIEFWNAWHITLSNWLRDYLFMPLGKAFIKRWKGSSPVTSAAASYVVTFGLAGLWHGDGLNFLLWGLYMGLGLSACKLWGEITRSFPAGYHRFMFDTRPGRLLAIFVNFHFLLFGWIIFANDLGRAIEIVPRLFGAR